MTREELSSKTVAELKALARKQKIALPAGARKADIIKILAKAGSAAGKKGRNAAVEGTGRKAAAKPAARAAKMKMTSRSKQQATAGAAASKKRSVTRKTPAAAAAGQAGRRSERMIPAGAEGPLMNQERVSDAKYFTGPPEPGSAKPYGTLPYEYGEERIALMARDTSMVYGYWELPQSRLENEKARFGRGSILCVRVYDVTGVQWDGSNATAYFDQEVHDRVGTWYFDLDRPAHSFCADVGLRSPDGRFLTLLRSNIVTLPREGISDVLDEEWMLLEEQFMKLCGVTSEPVGGRSSQQVQEALRQRQMREITSPGMYRKQKTKKD